MIFIAQLNQQNQSRLKINVNMLFALKNFRLRCINRLAVLSTLNLCETTDIHINFVSFRALSFQMKSPH